MNPEDENINQKKKKEKEIEFFVLLVHSKRDWLQISPSSLQPQWNKKF